MLSKDERIAAIDETIAWWQAHGVRAKQVIGAIKPHWNPEGSWGWAVVRAAMIGGRFSMTKKKPKTNQRRNSPRPWTEAEKDIAFGVFIRGGTVREAAAACGRSYSTTSKIRQVLQRERKVRLPRVYVGGDTWIDHMPQDLDPYPWKMPRFEDDPKAARGSGMPPKFFRHRLPDASYCSSSLE